MPSHKQTSHWRLPGIMGVLVVLILSIGWLVRHASQSTTPVPVLSAVVSNAVNNPPPIAGLTTNPSDDALAESLNALRTKPDASTAKEWLAQLRATLSAMPTNEAVALIRRFLDSKQDAATQLGFKISNAGWLDEAPTLRTFLLDELARLDPAAAADYAKVILAAKDSPDEWAVALRNLARGDVTPEGRQLLAQKTAELLQHEPWRQNPSVGYLEAFDAAVYLGGTSLMPTLADMVRQKENTAVAHASYLTLDRLVINTPATTLATLLADPDLMAGRELTRANYFARADVRDSQQRQLLENYLLNPGITPAELDAFASVFPNANFMISPNLLTSSPTLDHTTLVIRDVESLRVVQEWLADPRFARLKPALQRAVQRLHEFVQQAGQGK